MYMQYRENRNTDLKSSTQHGHVALSSF